MTRGEALTTLRILLLRSGADLRSDAALAVVAAVFVGSAPERDAAEVHGALALADRIREALRE